MNRVIILHYKHSIGKNYITTNGEVDGEYFSTKGLTKPIWLLVILIYLKTKTDGWSSQSEIEMVNERELRIKNA